MAGKDIRDRLPILDHLRQITIYKDCGWPGKARKLVGNAPGVHSGIQNGQNVPRL